MKKKADVLSHSSSYKESLARLAQHPDFKAFLRIIEIEEKNIVIMSFKINSSDPDLSRKKAHLEGRVFELRKMKNTFEMVTKEGED